MPDLGRRQFITLLGGAAAWPLTARAQQPGMPVIGYVSGGSPEPSMQVIAVLKQGLAEVGLIDGRNVAFEYRYAEGRYDRLPTIAAELVRRPVSVIVATTTPPALAAKAATSTIPIVFGATDDPVRLGLVASLSRPGGNATGVFFFLSDLGPKRLGLLREVVPTASRIGLLINPNHENAEAVRKDVTAAGTVIGATIETAYAGDSASLEDAFATLVRNKADALVVATDPFFFSRRSQLAILAAKHAIPTIYNTREFAEAGGLMSYGTSLTEMFRQLGVYTGRILKGEKPSDLPVVQSIRFELAINLKTARVLGLDLPPTLLARADEVIE
jgi:putative ABC transport system substrate-binding protein